MYNYVFNDDLRNMNMTNNSYNMIPKMMNTSLYNPLDGYNKGNLFPNLYSQYKNYRPMNINPRNEQERLMYEIQTICFAAHELNLYLDLHPEDSSMIMLFKDYSETARKLKNEYESKYGPITVSNINNENLFTWQTDKWPWDRNINRNGGNYNV